MIKILEHVEKWECTYKDCKARCCIEGRPLTLRDLKNIGEEIRKNWNEFAIFDEKEKLFKLKGINRKCIFLGSDLNCTIRESEPLICRILPFEIAKVQYSEEPIMQLKTIVECPGYGFGEEIDRFQIERDATLFLRENQKLIKEIKEKGIKEIMKSL